jgi:hypothetical protein
MSTANLRLVAGGLTLIVAVLVGVVTGFAGSSTGCVSDGTNQQSDQQGDDQPAPRPSGAPSGGGFDWRPAPSRSFGSGGGDGQVIVAADGSCGRAFSVRSALAGFAGSLAAGVIAGGMLLYTAQRRRTVPAGPPDPTTAVAPASPALGGATPVGPPTGVGSPPVQPVSGQPAGRSAGSADGRAAGERAALIQTCIYVRDRATSQAIADHLGRVLAEVGVTTVAPKGRFDPSRHEAGGSASTQDENLDGTIAGVELPGYTDRGAVLRAPVVTVYRRAAR